MNTIPFEAQLSSITAIQPADVNNDGKMDLLLGFNQYEWMPQFSRMDGGYGGVLLNQGNRIFNFIASTNSGIQITGQTRDIKSLILNGKRSFLFLQNNSAPLVFQFDGK